MTAIPFKIPIGFEYTGLMRLDHSNIVVEFEKWSWRKMSKQIIEVVVPVGEVVSVAFTERMLETRIDMQLLSMQAGGEIPRNKPGLIQFQFAQRYREAARTLAAHLSALIAEARLDQLEGELRSLEK